MAPPASWGAAAAAAAAASGAAGAPAMDQERARRLVAEGGSLLLLGVPRGTEFGLDYMSWTTGDRFQGVKMVPPEGAHYVRWSPSEGPAGSAGLGGPAGGFFCFLGRADVLVRRWDGDRDALVPERGDGGEDEARLANGVRAGDFDRGLAPYPLDTLKKWKTLSCRITPATVRRLSALPGGGGGNGVGGDGGGASPHHHGAFTSLTFAEVPPVRVPDDATPEERTALHRDRSACLDRLIDGALGGCEAEVLGELQAAFVAFFLGNSYEGFEQWKALLTLLCGCEAAVVRRPALYAGLAASLGAQLEEVPLDFFRGELGGGDNNFLLRCAGDLFEIVSETPEADEDLVRAMRGLAAVLRRRFAWHSPFFYLGTAEALLEQAERDDEFAPVIANLDELQLGSAANSDAGSDA